MSQTGGTFSAFRISKGQLSKAKHLSVSLNLNLKADISLLMFLMYFKMRLAVQPYAE